MNSIIKDNSGRLRSEKQAKEGKDENNHFFDILYANFEIKRVLAKRSINANPEKRGALNELLINNYTNNFLTI